MAIIHVTDDQFRNDVLASKIPVLVDFWAEWCAPCKQISPILEEIATETHGHLTIAKINIDDNPETPTKFHVRGIPTLMLFSQGEVVATKTGIMSKNKLSEWIGEYIQIA